MGCDLPTSVKPLLIITGIWGDERYRLICPTEAGGYKIGEDRYVPDVAFVNYQKQKEPNKHGYNDVIPDLVVEVVSDAMNKREWNALIRKITGYLNAGVIVWGSIPKKKPSRYTNMAKKSKSIPSTTRSLYPHYCQTLNYPSKRFLSQSRTDNTHLTPP